jgi:hypothetical protein
MIWDSAPPPQWQKRTSARSESHVPVLQARSSSSRWSRLIAPFFLVVVWVKCSAIMGVVALLSVNSNVLAIAGVISLASLAGAVMLLSAKRLLLAFVCAALPGAVTLTLLVGAFVLNR